MKKRMIVYASCGGTTAECAELLAKRLGGAELYDLSCGIPFVLDVDTVIIGSYVHMGTISREVKRFIVKNSAALTAVHLGFYICNASIEQADDFLNANFPVGLLTRAVCVSTFGGRIETEGLRGLDLLVARKMKKSIDRSGAEPPHLLPHIIDAFADRILAAEQTPPQAADDGAEQDGKDTDPEPQD